MGGQKGSYLCQDFYSENDRNSATGVRTRWKCEFVYLCKQVAVYVRKKKDSMEQQFVIFQDRINVVWMNSTKKKLSILQDSNFLIYSVG